MSAMSHVRCVRGLARLAIVAGLLATPGRAHGHDLERTQVTISFEADGSFVVDVANDPNWLLLRLEPFAGPAAPRTLTAAERDARLRQLAPVFMDRFVLFVDGREVRPQSAEYLTPRVQRPSDTLPPLATYRAHGRMPPGVQTLRWFYGIVIDPYPMTVRRADGLSITEWIGGQHWSRSIDLRGQFETPSPRTMFVQYFNLGYTHILPKGLDHILFVLGLFLLSAKFRPIWVQVTAFTVAHSITLGLTMYGIVSLPSGIVEPLIALSITYVAIENLATTTLKPWRLALVFSFGLLHGMGFAGVLKELGLPRSQFLTALLSFNLGVEAGQMTVIVMAAAGLAWCHHREWYRRRVVMPASTIIAGVGLYWTISRAIG